MTRLAELFCQCEERSITLLVTEGQPLVCGDCLKIIYPWKVTSCDTCNDTGRVLWMVESDPHSYQEPDEDGKVPCPDCRHSEESHFCV